MESSVGSSAFGALTVPDWILVLQLVVLLVQVCVSVWLVRVSMRTSRYTQAGETSLRCQERYEALVDTRDAVETPQQEDRYYDRFWGAQADQFVHWRNDLIPDETYAEWMAFRRRQYRSDKTLRPELNGLTVTFRAAWGERYERHYKHRLFGRFMTKIFEGAERPGHSEPKDLTHITETMKAFKRMPAPRLDKKGD